MPKFLEQKLRSEYGNNPSAIYGTMNKIGAMHGNKETAKGRQMEKKHEEKMAKTSFHHTHIQHHDDGSHTVEHFPHSKRKSAGFMEQGEPKSYSAGDGEELMDKLHEHLGVGEGGEGDGGEME